MKSDFRSYLFRRLKRIKGEFKRLWKNYLYQSLLAAFVLALILFVLSIQHAVVVASIGATAFIVFIIPRNITARPRRVIGGHIIGLVTGSLIALIPHDAVLTSVLVYAFAVGISIFLMVTLDCEHPPASGTALGVAMTGFSSQVMIAVVTSSILLAVVHRFLGKYLRELT
jgi:CBS-domain-containing membrane protein